MGSETAARINREAPLTDVHVHPSLKAWLFRRNLWKHYSSGWGFNPLSSRSDFQMLEKGEVRVIWSALYLPERELFRRCFPLKVVALILVPYHLRLMKGSLFGRLIEMMDQMEGEIERRPDRVELARSVADLDRITAAGKLAVLHTVEGAHALEGKLENLDVLAARGVAMITLTHFYPNGVAAPTNAIPADMFPRCLCKLAPEVGDDEGLTAFGRRVIERMAELNIIVDITHCSPRARRDVYDVIGAERPIVASHVGLRSLMDDPYNLADDEIERIADGGGAVGIIFYNHWLSDSEPPATGLDPGLANIWKTAKAIRDVTGSWDHVMLGTDFDGFTDPPDDAEDSSKMARVTDMLLRMQVSEIDIKKILGGNARRVLEHGWL